MLPLRSDNSLTFAKVRYLFVNSSFTITSHQVPPPDIPQTRCAVEFSNIVSDFSPRVLILVMEVIMLGSYWSFNNLLNLAKLLSFGVPEFHSNNTGYLHVRKISQHVSSRIFFHLTLVYLI